ncbi:MAG: hypothetical protein K2N69_04690 [Helicobacter sp.]|nr:hypothetical protein [Helicobacter sp.]
MANVSNISQSADIAPKANAPTTQATQTARFNATLPIAIEVLEKLSPTRYKLRLGNTTITTQSLKELLVGGKYWAQMGNGRNGTITLSQLIAQPKILSQLANAPLRLNEENLREMLSPKNGNPWDNFKNQLIERASMAESRGEFNFYMQMLLSMHNRVLTLPLAIERREGVLQMRKKRKKTGLYELEFYAVFGQIGALRGRLVSDGEAVDLYITTQYERSAELLRSTQNLLNGIAYFSIEVNHDIAPLYELKDAHSSLLDVKG